MDSHFHLRSPGASHDDLPFTERNALQWAGLQRRLFPAGAPAHATWNGSNRIVDVLDIVGEIPDVNHMHLPWGGGMDLVGAESSVREPGCVELKTPGSIYLVKTEHLHFESFNDDPAWAYFWLDTVGLEPSGEGSVRHLHESVTDIGGNFYADWSCRDEDNYGGEPLPENSRRVVRCLRGSFLIVQKTSLYNRISQTYDGRHNKMGADGFRKAYEIMVAKRRS
jgi:hypothetical protein